MFKQLSQVLINEGSVMSLGSHLGRAAAVITGGSVGTGRDIALVLAGWTWPTVIVYLDNQCRVEATVAEIIAAGGTTVAVRADLADDLDVERMFTESIAAFGSVDVVVHTTTGDAAPLYLHAARYLRQRGALVSTPAAQPITPRVRSQLRERGITVEWVEPESMPAFLDSWSQNAG
jgi:3-oxoacyl-[acyl-carrier protein] reductase